MTTTSTLQHKEALARDDREGWRDWVRNVQDEQAVAEGCFFDIEAAERVREFFRRCVRIKDKRTKKVVPFTLLDWQWQHVVAPLFGWKRPDGSRRFRFAWVEIAKKNGKTELSAAIAYYLLMADGEPEPEVYGVAVSVGQVKKTLWKSLANIHHHSPSIRKFLEIKQGSEPRLVCQQNRGYFAVLANKAGTADGINPHALIYDEVHRWGGRELYDALLYGDTARVQPLQIVITTAGNDRQSLGYELHERAEKIVKGSIIDTETLVYIAAADKDDDPADPATWRKANPSLGVILDESRIAAEYQAAKDSPAALQNFRRLKLNQWVHQTSRWLDFDRWASCPERCDTSELEGLECYGGLDLSSKHDLTSFVLQFPRLNADGQMVHDVMAWHWLPEENLEEQERAAGVPYRQWAEMGLLELTPGDHVDYRFIRQRINELAKRFSIKQIAYDPAYCGQLALELIDDGLECFEFWARPTMYNPVLRYVETAIYDSRLRHGNNPMLDWQAGNIEVQENIDGLIKPVKVRNAQKIDGIVALAMSMGKHCQTREEKQEIYDESPLIMLGR